MIRNETKKHHEEEFFIQYERIFSENREKEIIRQNIKSLG
jgi:hypothetical protein